MAAKKKTAKKKAAKKKAAKKTASKKKVVKKKAVQKKTSKKTSKKKVVKKAAKKKASGKKVAKKASKKKSVTKKTGSKKSSMSKKKSSTTAGKKKTSKKTASKPAAVKKKVAVKKTASKRKAKSSDSSTPDFVPYERQQGEDYMNAAQLDHFREILLNWKHELLDEVNRTVDHMKEDASNFPDPADRATQEEEFGLELRTRDRERKLLRKINAALTRIDDGTYGYCEETGEEIGLKRLEARPVATLCLEAQERRELRKRQFRDSDDRAR